MLNGDNITVNAKEGNNVLSVNGKNNKITAGNGKNTVSLSGSDSSVKTGSGDETIYVDGKNIRVTTAGGDNVMRIYGENNIVTAGDGKNTIGMIGDSNTLNLGNGMQKIAFWGNNNNISMGDGNSQVMTIDQALKTNAKKWADLEDAWVQRLDSFNTSEKANSNVIYDYTNCTNPIYASLSDEDKAFAETIDMTEMKDGHPKYVIAGDSDGNPVFYVYSYSYGGRSFYYQQGHAGDQKFKTIIAQKNVVKAEAAYEKYDSYQMNYYKNYVVDGVTGNNIKFGDGDNTLKWTLQDGDFQLDFGTAKTGHTLVSQQSYTFADETSHPFVRYDVVNREFYTIAAEE